MKRLVIGLVLAVLLGAPLSAEAISHGPRELGTVILGGLDIKDGKVSIRVDSGGCTDKTAIKAKVQKEKGLSERAPHYVVTFERVRVDDCKALLFDGTVLEYDLAEDLDISGAYTLTVTNRVFPRSSDAIAEENGLKRDVVAAMIRALGMELGSCERKLKTAQGGVGPAGNVEKFKQRLAELKDQQASFQKLNPNDYALGTGTAENPEAFLEQPVYGPVTPPLKKTVGVVVKEACKEGSILEVEGMTKSGPFYHLVGIDGNDYSRLKIGQKYALTLYLVYKREYFGPVSDYYAYIAAVK